MAITSRGSNRVLASFAKRQTENDGVTSLQLQPHHGSEETEQLLSTSPSLRLPYKAPQLLTHLFQTS